MDLAKLGLIGNGQCAALVDDRARIVWCCLPRWDAEPVFGELLDPEGGAFAIGPADGSTGVQMYIENTNVLETRFTGPDGSFRVIDFAPRFVEHQRQFHPPQLVRVVEPISGTPMIRVRCDPVCGWSKRPATGVHGSNHVAYEGLAGPLRLTTDLPLSSLDGLPVRLTARRHFVLTWGAPVEVPLESLAERFLRETTVFWQEWVKECVVPPMYQQAVIRSALTLKLHCFEDTGAIAAALTTSIPEQPGTGRTWDYRFCWLRDAFYVLRALRRLGHFSERERFLEYLMNIAASHPDLVLAPLYRIDGSPLDGERELEHWAGFNGEGPVRVGNAAASQRQNDVYGELVIAMAPLFVDDRFAPGRTPEAFSLVERLARKAVEVAGQPDAGLWEGRGAERPHAFSALMCWAAADRMAHIAHLRRPDIESFFRTAATRLHKETLLRHWSRKLECLVAGDAQGDELDAAMLQAVPLRFFGRKMKMARQSTRAIERALSRNGLLLRYMHNDGFGVPKSAFLVCTFWLVEALAAVGHEREARETMERALAVASPLGLLSEDCEVDTHRLWGNFPQAYSHVGLIHAAFAASPTWDEVL